MEENVSISKHVIGIYTDSVTRHHPDGKTETQVDPLKKNLIVSAISTFMASLIQGSTTGGVLYWAIGTGTQASNSSITSLVNEVNRKKAIISFVDNSNNPVVTPTNKISVSASWAQGELGIVTLTEFAIFGGNNANLSNYGYALDYVAHSPISMDNTMSLERTIYFTF